VAALSTVIVVIIAKAIAFRDARLFKKAISLMLNRLDNSAFIKAEFFLSVTDAGKSLMYAKSPLEILKTKTASSTALIPKHLAEPKHYIRA
jgi:hypothetical protein